MPRIGPYDTVQDRLRVSRLALGFTPTTISRLIGSPSSYWHNLEAGTRRLSIDKALVLKRATGLTLEWIFDADRSSLPPKISRTIDAWLAKQQREKNNTPKSA